LADEGFVTIGSGTYNIAMGEVVIAQQKQDRADCEVAIKNHRGSIADNIAIGSPPAWTSPVEDSQLKPGIGDIFRDINAAHYPSWAEEARRDY
jgi:hypothetical protein